MSSPKGAGFAEAERRLAAAGGRWAVQLDLSWLMLTAIPDWLGDLTCLIWLNLGGALLR